jgi:hypothetical protein
VSKASAAPIAGPEPTLPPPEPQAIPLPEQATIRLPEPQATPAPEQATVPPLPTPALQEQTVPLPSVEATPAVPAAPRSRAVPILVGVGTLVALAVAGFVLWQTGVLPGWLNMGSKTATLTVQPSVTVSSTVEKPPSDQTSITPPQDGPVVTTLSEADSLDAIDSGYTTVTRFEDQFAAKKTGWIWSVWSKKIDTRNDPAALSALADEAKSWVDDMTAKRDEFTALAISDTYATYKQDLLDIFDLMIERANVYYKTSAYAVDHPTKADGSQPWRAVQDGTVDGGKSSAQAAADVKAALAAFTLP